ncbi:zf-HC2 domain-containing protein [Paenarthrobacter sp. NyZ202]|uniref:zf-HC2 domain-containing protein n=1 Tax=Paenarthrobacter sp. NyZ202 TaxID=3402689 RepID=UPI003CF576D4
MNGNSVHHLLGAYLLGGLTPDEARGFEEHLARCPDCRTELEALESLPALLDAVPRSDAVALTVAGTAGLPADPAPDSVPQKALVELSHRQRTSRRRWAACVGTVAAACLAIGFLAGPLVNQPPQPDATYSVQSGDGLQLKVGMVKKNWGTELAVEGQSMPREGTLYLWVKGRDGAEERTCGWTATSSGRIRITGATPVQLAGIAGVELRDASEKTVASISVP